MKTAATLADAEPPIETGTLVSLVTNESKEPVKIIESRVEYEHVYLVEYKDGSRSWRSHGVIATERIR